MTTTGRIKYIDITRGIAILCIVLGHLGNSQINRIVFTFHVPIFFFITGYFINNKLMIRDFIKYKVKTLLIPYVCTCIVIIFLGGLEYFIFYGAGDAKKAMLGWVYASVYGAGDAYVEPFYIKAIGAIWFLWAIFWGSIFLRGLLNVKTGTRILLVLVLFFIGSWSRKLFWFPLSIQAGCCATLFVYLGYLLKNIKKQLKELTIEVKTVLSILALAVWFSFIKNFQSFWLVHCDIGRGVIDIIGCICGCYIVVLIAKYIEKHTIYLSNSLSFFGRYSLFMLCIHMIELDTLPWGWVQQSLIVYGIAENFGLILVIIGKFFIIIPITIVCSKLDFVRRLFGFSSIKTGEV